MTYIKTLPNQNQIAFNHTNHSSADQVNQNLKIRFIFNGREDYAIGRRNLSLYPGSFLVFDQGTLYRQSELSEKKIQSLTLSFSNEFLNQFRKELASCDNYLLPAAEREYILEWGIADKIYPLTGDIAFNLKHLQNYLEQEGGDDLLLQEYMDHCLLNCYMLYKQEMINSERRLCLVHEQSKKEVIKRLNLAKEFLQSNYNKKISLEDVAAYSSFSINHLIRTFNQAYNQTPHQFLIKLRLQRAKSLLKDTEYPVNEIGNIVGFESTSSFIRLFRECFDTTPLKFRTVEAC